MKNPTAVSGYDRPFFFAGFTSIEACMWAHVWAVVAGGPTTAASGGPAECRGWGMSMLGGACGTSWVCLAGTRCTRQSYGASKSMTASSSTPHALMTFSCTPPASGGRRKPLLSGPGRRRSGRP